MILQRSHSNAYGDGVEFFATVAAIDPAETIRDGVSTYRSILEFSNDDPRVRVGMTANITITTAEKENVIAIPRAVVMDDGNGQYVYVKEGESIGTRQVTTGLVSSLGTIEITSGLEEGDVVILQK